MGEDIKEERSRGIRGEEVFAIKLSLAAKWWWRFSKDNESLWVNVVMEKYNLDQRSWLSKCPSRGSISTVWKDICSVGDHSSSVRGIVQEGFKIKVCAGNNIYFWNHSWIGPHTLKEDFPRLFLLSTQ